MTAYTPAPEVERIAEKLIHEHHRHLEDVPIRYLWRDKAAVAKGNVVLGKARKIGGLNAHLAHYAAGADEPPEEVEFFVMEIGADWWKTLTQEQQVALVDHELSHFGVEIPEQADKERKLVIRGHDLEEFAAVVERHGLWRPDVETFREVLRQPSLFDDEAA